VLVRAVEILARKGVDCRLKVAGEDSCGLLESEVRQASPKLPIDYLGRVTDEELVGLYQSAICTVVPSTYEGFGLPVLEAMAHGCPVLSSGGGALREVGGDAALYFPTDSADKLAETICRLTQDQELREKCIRRGRDNLSKFSWDRCARDHRAIFEELG